MRICEARSVHAGCMIPASVAGVWAAERIPTPKATWIPATPAGEPAHYFLVVSSGAGGVLRAFIRNPEFNAGTVFGTRDTLPAVNADGTLTLPDITPDSLTLTFHRASEAELRWFYPRQTPAWRYHPPDVLPDGWRVGTLASAGMDEAPIAALMAPIVALRSPMLLSPYIHSISIERHGVLVLDEYFYGFTAETPHDVRSAGKSVTTLLAGRAIEDSHRFTPSSHVLPLLTKYAPVANDDARKRAMTVGDLMTMSSGLACDDNDDNSPGNENTMQSRPAGTDWYRYTLDLPMTSQPGTRAVYCTAGINLLGAIISAATDTPLTSYFQQRFASPMQFGTYAMWLQPNPAPFAYMGGGDHFRPRDFLKFGALLLDGGTWNGRSIVDRSWIDASIVPRSAPEGEGDRYGYGWHLWRVDVDGRSYDVVNAGGNGGQLMIVVPKLDVAVMVTAGNYNQYPVWRRFLPDVVRAVISSCHDAVAADSTRRHLRRRSSQSDAR